LKTTDLWFDFDIILKIYDRYTEDISRYFRDVLSILNMISIFSVAVIRSEVHYILCSF